MVSDVNCLITATNHTGMKILMFIVNLFLMQEPTNAVDVQKVAENTGEFLSSLNTALQAVKDGLHNVKVVYFLVFFVTECPTCGVYFDKCQSPQQFIIDRSKTVLLLWFCWSSNVYWFCYGYSLVVICWERTVVLLAFRLCCVMILDVTFGVCIPFPFDVSGRCGI